MLFRIIIIIIIIVESFSQERWLVGFLWGVIDSKSPQLSRTLLSILALLKTAVVLMVSILPILPIPIPRFSAYSYECTKNECTKNEWYHLHPHVPQFFF